MEFIPNRRTALDRRIVCGIPPAVTAIFIRTGFNSFNFYFWSTSNSYCWKKNGSGWVELRDRSQDFAAFWWHGVHKSCEKWRLGNNKKEFDLSLGKNNKKVEAIQFGPVPYKKTRRPKTNKNPYRHQLLLLRMFMHSEKDIEKKTPLGYYYYYDYFFSLRNILFFWFMFIARRSLRPC
jgi:hypothetical protein